MTRATRVPTLASPVRNFTVDLSASEHRLENRLRRATTSGTAERGRSLSPATAMGAGIDALLQAACARGISS